MKFNRKKFFDGVRSFLKSRRLTLTQKRVDALEFLLTAFESEPKWRDIRHIAYALATIAHETAWTFEPIKEFRAAAGSKGRKNQDRYWLSGYYGRGYVQLTWRQNYERFGLENDPDKALDPPTAFFVLTEGMHKGIFTGKKLSDYISDTGKDYRGARKIINGLDKANLIAGYAQEFEEILRASKVSTATVPQKTPATPTQDGILSANTSEQAAAVDAPEVVASKGSVWIAATGALGALGAFIFGADAMADYHLISTYGIEMTVTYIIGVGAYMVKVMRSRTDTVVWVTNNGWRLLISFLLLWAISVGLVIVPNLAQLFGALGFNADQGTVGIAGMLISFLIKNVDEVK